MSVRTFAEASIVCDAVIGRDLLGDIYCSCRATGRGDSVEVALAEAERKARAAGWLLTAPVGRDLCQAHRGTADPIGTLR